MMISIEAGETNPDVEVTNISAHGIWLLAHGKEQFLSYDDFPWFRDQAIKAITHVEEPTPGHYYWPDLDVDLTEEIIARPEHYPNVAKGNT
jgi:hypothetical protein